MQNHCPHCGHVSDPAEGLTKRQRDAMLVIQELTDANGGIAPSYREIAAEMDIPAHSVVAVIVSNLEARGYIARGPHQSQRSITILRRVPVPADQIDLEEAIERERAAA